MSCLIVCDESIASIADTILKCILFRNYTGFGFSNQRNILAVINSAKKFASFEEIEKGVFLNHRNLCQALSEMNHNAYISRYRFSQEETFTFDYSTEFISYKTIQKQNNNLVIPVENWQILKSTDCFVYQCEEDKIVKTPLYEACEDFRDNYFSFMMNHYKDYLQVKNNIPNDKNEIILSIADVVDKALRHNSCAEFACMSYINTMPIIEKTKKFATEYQLQINDTLNVKNIALFIAGLDPFKVLKFCYQDEYLQYRPSDYMDGRYIIPKTNWFIFARFNDFIELIKKDCSHDSAVIQIFEKILSCMQKFFIKNTYEYANAVWM